MISIVIPNCNGRRFLATCFDSLRDQAFRKFEIILVDNGSTDDSVEFVRENYPEVRIIELRENKGFSVAVNEGIKQSKGEFVALLNNDTKADPKWLKELFLALVRNPTIGFCASKILLLDKPKIIYACGNSLGISGNPVNIGIGEKDSAQFEKEKEVFGACAAAAIYRKSVLEDIGLFDEDFHSFYEDVDISFRAQLSGYKCLYVPTAVVYHQGGGTAGVNSNLSVYYTSRNHLSLLIKNLPMPLLVRHSPLFLIFQLYTAAHYLKIGRFKAFLKGKIHGLAQIRKTIAKRKQIQAKVRVSTEYIHSLLVRKNEDLALRT